MANTIARCTTTALSTMSDICGDDSIVATRRSWRGMPRPRVKRRGLNSDAATRQSTAQLAKAKV